MRALGPVALTFLRTDCPGGEPRPGGPAPRRIERGRWLGRHDERSSRRARVVLLEVRVLG